MLDGIKRWFTRAPTTVRGWSDFGPWAESRGWIFRGVRESEGFVIEGRSGASEWRLEWGPSQRPYIDGFEMRLRSELPVDHELHALVLNRELMESMEKAVFEQFVEDVQTRIDTQTPPEMRWLVMYPKLSGSELKNLRESYAAVASVKPFLRSWLAGSLADGLVAVPRPAGSPMALALSRGRLTLRVPMTTPELALAQSWVQLFETALREGRRAAIETADQGPPSTRPSLFSASAPDTGTSGG